ncbi:protein of unknown function [Moritella yayanosii]|uniref:Uncharacterized protein n=1 Tax=Moritella yayanosii TaxID=69539 RepID=A0A330LS68_9GAMM|nr:protein of unknown function [Moritella yayanosii]
MLIVVIVFVDSWVLNSVEEPAAMTHNLSTMVFIAKIDCHDD